MENMHVSVIVPAFNEAEALPELLERIDRTLQECSGAYEIVIIDDGSTDQTPGILRRLSTQYPHMSAIRFRRNYGKAAALSEGFDRAQGDFLITLDADLQDAPEEIPRFLAQLAAGADVVSGWKQGRQDDWTRIISSHLFNAGTRLMTGLTLHDMNCGLKGYRSQVVQELRLYGEMHRFIPVIARQRGFSTEELSVPHFPRRYGRSRYGWSRSLSGIFDLITLVMLGRYTHKPLHFFGLIGLSSGLLGIAITVYLVLGWIFGQWIGNRPLFLVGIFLLLSGLQFIFFGLMAELFIFLSGTREDCSIAEVINSPHHNGHDRIDADPPHTPVPHDPASPQTAPSPLSSS